MQILELRNPVFIEQDNSGIALEVQFDDNEGVWEYITVRPNDPPTAAIYAAALSGDFGEIAPYVEPSDPQPDDDYTERGPEYIIADATKRTQSRLDEFAKTRNYDGILSAATYATSTVPKFASEGQYAVQARDATWAALYAMMEAVQTEQRAMPSNYAEVEAELPALEWPV